jgi:sulfide dehydrogenase cytochrome subunit
MLCGAAISTSVAQEAALPVGLCETCHGPNGASVTPGIPSLAGQNEPYLFESLKELRGERGSSPTMRGILAGRPDDELQRLARHFATRPYYRRVQEVDPVRVARGREAYLKLCQICHHEEGRSTSYAEYPLLAGQDLGYLLRVMGLILDGQRRVYAIKRDLISLASREQIDDAIHFFASQKVAPDQVTTALNSSDEKRSRRSRFKTP